MTARFRRFASGRLPDPGSGRFWPSTLLRSGPLSQLDAHAPMPESRAIRPRRGFGRCGCPVPDWPSACISTKRRWPSAQRRDRGIRAETSIYMHGDTGTCEHNVRPARHALHVDPEPHTPPVQSRRREISGPVPAVFCRDIEIDTRELDAGGRSRGLR